MTRSSLTPLVAGMVCVFLGTLTADSPRPEKIPFRVLHSNDTTNAVNCLQSRFTQRPPMSDRFIRDTVDEAANCGIDVHMLQPGRGWVPWWQSDNLPIAPLLAWKKANKIDIPYMEKYVAAGGDVMRVFVEQCRRKGQHPFVSFRMNDQHHIHPADRGRMSEPEFSRKAGVCPFYINNPQWRIGSDGKTDLLGQLSMDFAFPQVREFRLRQIRELVGKYDIDGLELDFVRHTALFNQNRTTTAQRAQILAVLVAQVRAILDVKTRVTSRRLWLGVRIPAYPQCFDRMGIDLPALAAAGLDFVNASSHYYTDAQQPVAELRKQLPENVALYTELHFTNALTIEHKLGNGKKQSEMRRCTPLQLQTTAYLARKRGADGVSTFNFQYYRGTYSQADVAGSSSKPPYAVFKDISDLDWLSRQPQHYVAAFIGNILRLNHRPLHSTVKQGAIKRVLLDMTPPAGGWRADGKLRIQATSDLGGSTWGARLNGILLEPASDTADLFPNPYPDGIGQPADYRAWKVPAALLKDSVNTIELLYKNGPKTIAVRYLDLALP